jgi:hypothetical protein
MYSSCNTPYVTNHIPYYGNTVTYNKMGQNNGDRFIGFGLAPFLLGGLAGGALVSAARPPIYPAPYPMPMPTPMPMPYQPYMNYPTPSQVTSPNYSYSYNYY